MSSHDPVLHSVPIRKLRPTQMTVGFREVEDKRRSWRVHVGKDGGARFLGAHMIPVLLGPKEKRYVVDHHHLARALLDDGVEDVLTTVVADLSHLDKDAFWVVADHLGWAHPYDAQGIRRPTSDIPKRIADLTDDPFRSLAGALRRMGGYAKNPAPFAEFLWADFLRRRLDARLVETDFEKTAQAAMRLVKSPDAAHLPGWSGPAHGWERN